MATAHSPRVARREWLYLVAVAACAIAFVAQVLDLAAPPSPAGVGKRPSTGEARDVDMEALRERIRQGYLSDRDALFAHPLADGE